MLVPARMRAGLVAALLLGTSSAASAGGYLGLGVGTAPATSGDMSFAEDGRSGRLQIGYRFGRLAVEGLGSRYDLIRNDGHLYTGTTLAVAGKYNHELGDKFEAFGRAGLQRTSLDVETSNEPFDGNGWLIGGGFEYRVNLGVVGGAIFVDYTIARTGLKSDLRGDMEFGMTSRTWTLGATVAF